MSPFSIQSRFAVTFAANTLRSFLNFATGLIVARAMGPERYGDVVFLLGSFEAIRQAVSLGTGNAFFTFISRDERGFKFVLAYWGWQLFQLALTVMTIGLLLPDAWRGQIWLGQDRDVVLLACLAVFCQSQAWQTAMQIGEARRLTFRMQTINFAVALAHFGLVALTAWFGALVVRVLLWFLIGEYLAALVAAWWLLQGTAATTVEDRGWRIGEWAREYFVYCAPLVLYSAGSFAYEFADKWLLQRFGGSEQQAYFSVGAQFSAVCLLATTSMVRILWKEAADLHQRNDLAALETLYLRTSRSLFAFGAMLGGLLWPWSQEIALQLLGEGYQEAAVPLAIMFLYPMHQSLGQVMQTIFLATGQTVAYFWIGISFMLSSIPVTFLVLSPIHDPLPGLGLGATGMAIKTLVLNALFVNLYVWYLARKFSWSFSIAYQIMVAGWCVIAGGVAYMLASHFPPFAGLSLAARCSVAALAYLLMQVAFVTRFPLLVGVSRESLFWFAEKCAALVRRRAQ